MCVILLFSIFTAAGAYQESTTTDKTVITYLYTQSGLFDFIIDLKNNFIYDKTSIKPGQETIFKNIVDDINGMFIYNYYGNESAKTTGEYYLTAQLKTDLWQKNYVIIPKSNFSSNEKTASFNFVFPVNLTFYENIISKIDGEIGMKAKNPTLNIKCNIVVSSQTSKGFIYDSFSHSINVSIDSSIIEFGGELSQYDTGSLTTSEEMFLQSVVDKRNTWASTSIVFIAILIGFVFVTENITEKYDKTQKLVNKIKKKYGEWIVDVDNIPQMDQTKIIIVKQFDDLVKISEETSNPILCNESKDFHKFYVLTENFCYTYELKKK